MRGPTTDEDQSGDKGNGETFQSYFMRDWSKTFNGEFCPRGHTRRYLKDRKCAECKQIHAAKWRKANPERHLGKPLTVWLNRIKRRARENGVEFELTVDDLVIPDVCPLLGIPLIRGRHNSPNMPSLDRLDPDRGYVKGNVRVISFLANAMKRDATKEQLLLFATRLPEYLAGN